MQRKYDRATGRILCCNRDTARDAVQLECKITMREVWKDVARKVDLETMRENAYSLRVVKRDINSPRVKDSVLTAREKFMKVGAEENRCLLGLDRGSTCTDITFISPESIRTYGKSTVLTFGRITEFNSEKGKASVELAGNKTICVVNINNIRTYENLPQSAKQAILIEEMLSDQSEIEDKDGVTLYQRNFRILCLVDFLTKKWSKEYPEAIETYVMIDRLLFGDIETRGVYKLWTLLPESYKCLQSRDPKMKRQQKLFRNGGMS